MCILIWRKLKLRSTYPKPVDLSIEILREEFSANFFLQKWPDYNGGMPNVFNRSSIFAGEKADKKMIYRDQPVLSYVKDYELYYTGPELDKRDYQVFQLCLQAGKISNVEMGRPLRIFPAEWFKILKRTDNSRSRDELYNSLKKLTSANIHVLRTHKGYREEISGSLLSMAKRKEIIIDNDSGLLSYGKSKRDTKWLIAINPYTKDLFLGDLTLLDIHRSSQIKSCLGLWLYDFYSSHNEPIPLSISYLKDLSGSKSNLGHFTQSLKENLNKLKEIGFLSDYEITDKSRTEKMLSVNKTYKSPVVGINKGCRKEDKTMRIIREKRSQVNL